MTELRHGLGLLLVGLGILFFLACSVGLVRFPDVYARLHALTKADNLGLGLICIGLALQAESLVAALKLLLIWLLILTASSIAATLVASTARVCGVTPRVSQAKATSKRPAVR